MRTNKFVGRKELYETQYILLLEIGQAVIRMRAEIMLFRDVNDT